MAVVIPLRTAQRAPPSGGPAPGADPRFDALTLFLALVGLAPLAGSAAGLRFGPGELGVAAAMVLLSGRELARAAWPRRRQGRARLGRDAGRRRAV